jgi:lichenan operon transcriptional antiterminator
MEGIMTYLDYQRLDDILNYLISQSVPSTLAVLSKTLKVSTRTLRSDIKIINDYISDNGAQIRLIRKEGYIIDYSDIEKFKSFWSHQDTGTFLFTSADSRLTFLLRVFLTADDYISQNYLVDTLYISQNTLYNDFRILREKLAPFEISVVNKSNYGYKLEGDEYNRRLAIVNLIFQEDLYGFITSSNTTVRDVCHNIDYHQFSNIFYDSYSQFILAESDYFIKNAFATMLLTLSRIKKGYFLETFPFPEITFSLCTEILFNKFIASTSTAFDLTISEKERSYLKHVISENFPAALKNSQMVDSQESLAIEITDRIIHDLSLQISDQWIFDKELFVNLKEHLSRLLSIHTINIRRSNPILQTVKNNFPYAFELAVSKVQNIEKEYMLSFSEDELSYIALYFECAIEKYKNKTPEEVSIAIICATGQTLGSIIEAKIKRHLTSLKLRIDKLSYAELDALDDVSNYDFIISTVPALQTEHQDNWFYLDIATFEKNLSKIETAIMSNVQKEKAGKEKFELFGPQHFHVFSNKVSKKQLLKKMSDKLLEEGYVNTEFYNSVLEREKISNTAVDNIIAVPHPFNNRAHKSIISIAVVKKGIDWADETNVKFVFLLSIRPDDIKKIEYIYGRIVDFSSSDTIQKMILKDLSYDTFLEFFSQEK